MPTLTGLRSTLYMEKILDFCWFDGELPHDPHTMFVFGRNPKGRDRALLPATIGGIAHLSHSGLRYISARVSEPAWAARLKQNGNRTNLSNLFKQALVEIAEDR